MKCYLQGSQLYIYTHIHIGIYHIMYIHACAYMYIYVYNVKNNKSLRKREEIQSKYEQRTRH